MKTEIIKNNSSYEFNIKMKIIRDFGYELTPDSKILDFGCGSGKLVKEFRDNGYQAFGCGTRFINEENVDTDEMMKQGTIRTIDLENYSLPFEDNTFDFIFSQSVFEHVQNYSESIAEIARVLKPDGYCLHFFPARYLLKEPHVHVPFSTVIQSRTWLHLWTLLGIRNEWTETMNAKESADWFYNYLKKETNYLTRKQLTGHFREYFKDVIFCENIMLKYSPKRGKYLYALSKYLPFVHSVYSSFRSRAILTRLPIKISVPSV